MELSGIKHEVSNDYIYAVEKNKYLFKVLTKKDDVKDIIFYYKEKYTFNSFTDKNFKCLKMNKVCFDQTHDIFEIIISVDYICIDYYFEFIFKDGNKKIYANYLFYDAFNKENGCFDVSQYILDTQYFNTPDWSKNAIIYQIFPDRFSSSRMTIDEWNSLKCSTTSEMGGDLKGIINKLEYLDSLGINTIYLCPIFKSESYHKYSTTNYFEIDPCFGTNDDFKKLVYLAHKLNIRVIIDLVFNHSGLYFEKFNDIIKNDKNSKYCDWYIINSYPVKCDKDSKPPYKTFAYHKYMPKFNIDNKEVREYLISVAEFWYKFAKVDGFRLDVADEISHNFWQEFRNRIKSLNNDLLIVGERWYESKSFLQNQWDSHMNYIYRKAIIDFVCNDSINCYEFIERMNFLRGFYNINAYNSLWNLIDSHDTPRFLYFAKNDINLFKMAIVIQFLQNGAPFIYYGDEVGMSTNSTDDVDSRAPMVRDYKMQNLSLFYFYKRIIAIKKNYLNTFKGVVEYELIDNERGLIVYKKYDESGKNYYYVIINNSNEIKHYSIDDFKLYDMVEERIFENIIDAKSVYILKIIS